MHVTVVAYDEMVPLVIDVNDLSNILISFISFICLFCSATFWSNTAASYACSRPNSNNNNNNVSWNEICN